MKLQGAKINFLGDSMTEGAGASEPERVYWKLLEKRDGVIARGYGVGGSRIAAQRVPSNPKWDSFFRLRVAEMDPDADAVVVFGGTNDYGHGDAPLGRMTDRTDNTFYGAVHLLYQDLLEKYPQSHIVVMTPIHREGENNPVNDFGVRNVGCLADYVNIIRKVARYYALPLLDLYSLSGMQPEEEFLKERYNPDGLHPNDAGYERIYRLLREFLLRI